MAGLYIHIPFCVRKCAYCDFTSYPLAECNPSGYDNLIVKEAELYATEISDLSFQTIFIGGGTPSVLPPVSIATILQACFHNFNIQKDTEITIEANPATVSNESLALYRESGINRLSFGAQSFQLEELKVLGRIHDAKDISAAFLGARQAGITNINIDLMYGIPGQTLKSWEDSLCCALSLEPTHISCYNLILEEHTPIYAQVQSGMLKAAEEELELEMFARAEEILEQAGYKHYEVSNYALSEYECRHNINYWLNGEYLGLGCAAHSHIGQQRFENLSELIEYRNSVEVRKKPVLHEDYIDLKEAMFETVMLGLRMTEGISCLEFYKTYQINLEEAYPDAIRSNIEKGLLLMNERLFLTPSGRRIMNTVLVDFLD